MSKTRFAIPVVLALAAALATGVAHARDADVQWSVTIGAPAYGPPPVYRQPAPVYRQPEPRYRQPQPTYPTGRYQQPTHWDRDGDGIPNRHDRRYNPAWDVDGDGIPNRHDRYDARHSPRSDHDRDGVPNRYDRADHNPWRR
jgi:hypothetical protein